MKDCVDTLSLWLYSMGSWIAGISLSGPWESRLRAPHSSRLQPPFRCHLTPLGPSPASLPLLQLWAGARWASPTRNFSWGRPGDDSFRILWFPLLSPVDPSVWPRHATWPRNVGLGCGMSQRGVRGCRSFPEASGSSPARSASPGFL